jgi:hypothetical protein
MFIQRVELDDWRMCAEGSQREIYEHPDDPSVLIKIVKESQQGARGARKPKNRLFWFKRARRFGAYMTFRREIDEYLEQARKGSREDQTAVPIAKVFGLVETSKGLGIVVERITTQDGRLAPTLTDLLRDGRFKPSHLQLVANFFAQCSREHVVLMDARPPNFVVTDRSGYEELICVDGTGDKSAGHIYSTVKLLNAAKLKRYHAKLLTKIEYTANAFARLPSK